MATRVMLKNVVMAFPAIAQAQSYGDGDPAYGAKFPIEPNSENHKLIEQAMLGEATEQWKEKGEAILAMLAEDKKLCFSKTVYRSKKTGEPYEGFAGTHYLSARNATNQPTVIDQYGKEVTDKKAIERLAFSGAIVHASVEIWAQDNKWGRRINCSLRGIMLTGEGKNFGGGSAPASADEFAEFAKDAAEDAADLV